MNSEQEAKMKASIHALYEGPNLQAASAQAYVGPNHAHDNHIGQFLNGLDKDLEILSDAIDRLGVALVAFSIPRPPRPVPEKVQPQEQMSEVASRLSQYHLRVDEMTRRLQEMNNDLD